MFEKESEEYAKEVYGNRTDLDHYGIPEAFQNGAEFGYNKAKEKLIYAKAIIRELLDNSNEYTRQNAEDFIKE